MPKYLVTETVPQWVSYECIIEADSVADARAKFDDGERGTAGESDAMFGDSVSGVDVEWEASPLIRHRLLSADGATELTPWVECSRSDFEVSNRYSGEAERVRADLDATGFARMGGGAAPIVEIEFA